MKHPHLYAAYRKLGEYYNAIHLQFGIDDSLYYDLADRYFHMASEMAYPFRFQMLNQFAIDEALQEGE